MAHAHCTRMFMHSARVCALPLISLRSQPPAHDSTRRPPLSASGASACVNAHTCVSCEHTCVSCASRVNTRVHQSGQV
eukprot:449607-Rhodomonas_salina.2